MKLENVLQPKATLSRGELSRGLRALTWEGIASTTFSSITTSVFIVAFAIALGASNFQIGVLACIPFLTDLLQIPAIWLVETIRRRKVIVVTAWFASQLLWIPIALIPVMMKIPGSGAVSLLIGLMAIRGVLNAFTNCSWNSWLRDLVPQKIFGRYFARRLSLSTAVAVISGTAAAFFLDHWNAVQGSILGYTMVLLIGLVFFGLASPLFTAFIPEPTMPPATARLSLPQIMAKPVTDKNYRKLMKFLTFWGFSSNLVIPFFEVFMLRQLNLPIFTVIMLTIVSQISVVISLRIWGPLADKFGSKIILALSIVLFMITLLGWNLAVLPRNITSLLTVLVVLHILAGAAIAGITLTIGTLNLKLAPNGHATPYLAGASLAESAGAGIGALTGGFLADYLTGNTLIAGLTGFNVIFVLALVIGLLTLKFLQSIREPEAASHRDMLQAFINKTRNVIYEINPFMGMQYARIPVFSFSILAPNADKLFGDFEHYVGNRALESAELILKSIRGLTKKPPPRVVETRLTNEFKNLIFFAE